LKTIDALKLISTHKGIEVFLVGGFVRDYVRGVVNNDLDVVVKGRPINEVKAILKKYGDVKTVDLSKTNDEYTVNILLFKAFGDTTEAQITLPRRGDSQVQDFTHTLEDDAKHRDLRMNAMYLPINYTSIDDVTDFSGGKKDIEERVINSNGDPIDRLSESPIRMMRAIALSARTGYRLSEDLVRAIKKCSEMITKCPFEAIRGEFDEILLSSKPSKHLRMLVKTNLLKYISPELFSCVDVKQDERYHKYDVFTHLIYSVDNCDKNLVLRLAGLLHDVGKPSAKKEADGRITFHKHEMYSVRLAKDFLRQMKYESKTIKSVLLLIRLHMYHYTRDWTDSAVRKFIKAAEIPEAYISKEAIASFPLFRLRAGERLGNGLKPEAITTKQEDFERRIVEIYEESKCLDVKDLHIDGNIVMTTFGIKPGAIVGEVLRHLLELVLENPELNEREVLIELAKDYIGRKLNE